MHPNAVRHSDCCGLRLQRGRLHLFPQNSLANSQKGLFPLALSSRQHLGLSLGVCELLPVFCVVTLIYSSPLVLVPL